MKNILITALALTVTATALGVVPSHWDGGRNTPVHKLALRDDFGDKIDPGSIGALPVSTRKTCGQCHDYETIAGGWHFNSSGTNTSPGRASEPWFMIDSATGSQIPMSMRSWKGVYKPADLGMTNWEWTYAFGRHMPGGDLGEPADIYSEGGPNVRWEVSGKLEINCFACHTQDKMYDHSEYVRLMARENFAWAASGALGLGDVGGMGSRVPDYWNALHGLDKDDKIYRVPPHITYDMGKFDSKSRTVLEVGRPLNQNCLNCHSVTQVGMGHEDIDGDVHLRAGMSCTDCHSNGLEHDIARGSESDASGSMDRGRATASCAGCHNGTDAIKAGRFGAPAPKHVGIPLVHFEKLSCTVCHSGVTEDGKIAQVRTSKANRMGVYGRARWVTPAPFILEPVFVKNDEGKIEPRRISWPAFWGTRSDNGSVAPVKPEIVQESCADELNVREQLGAILKTLATDPNIPGVPALAIDGECFAANADGTAMPVKQDGTLKGISFVYLVEGENPASAYKGFNPLAGTNGLTAVQAEVYEQKLFNFSELLDVLEKDPLSDGRYGAVVCEGQIFYKTFDGMTNAPAGNVPEGAGYYLNGKFHSLIIDFATPVVQEFDPSADPFAMSSDKAKVFEARKKKFENLLQTLDASPLAERRYGAVIAGTNIWYRGGANEAVISANAPAGVASGTLGFFSDNKFESLLSDYVIANVKELGGSECTLTESMVTAGLKKLAESGQAKPVYIAHGKLWEIGADGTLAAKEDKVAAPVSWALGHDVRPARMARGAKSAKCADCHTAGSDFFFADVRSTGPLLTARNMVQSQIASMGLSGSYNKLFGMTFTVRPVLKIFLWIVFGLVSLVAVAFAAAGIPALLAMGGIPYGTAREQMMIKVDKLSAMGMIVSSAYLCVSGVAGWFFHLMTGYLLVMHILAGGLFALCLLALIWTRGGERIANAKKSWLWMLILALGVMVIFTAVAPMMTIFGSGWQEVLLQAHRCSTICFLVVGAWTMMCGGKD